MIRAGKPVANRSKHALHWLQYALLQQGRLAEARETMVMMRDDLAAVTNLNQQQHSVYMRASYIAEDPAGDQVLVPIESHEFPLDDQVMDRFSSGYRYVALGELDAARAELDSIRESIAGATVLSVEEGLHEDDSATSEDMYNIATILADELEALLLFHSGDTDAALALLAEAESRENARPLEYGPPYVPKPCSELMGEMLLTLERPEEALPHFQRALERNTSRTLSLIGLARSQEATGDPAAAETWELVRNNWRGDRDQLAQYDWLAKAENHAE